MMILLYQISEAVKKAMSNKTDSKTKAEFTIRMGLELEAIQRCINMLNTGGFPDRRSANMGFKG